MLSKRGWVAHLPQCYGLNLKSIQIRGELHYHNIRLYPIDHEDNDEEETSLNERIRVSV